MPQEGFFSAPHKGGSCRPGIACPLACTSRSQSSATDTQCAVAQDLMLSVPTLDGTEGPALLQL